MPNSAPALLCEAPAATRAAMARLRASCSLSLPLFFLVGIASIGMPCRLISLCTVVLLTPSRCAISPHGQALATQPPEFGKAMRRPRGRPAAMAGGMDARAGGYLPDHRVAHAELGADGAQREASGDALDDGTIAGLELRGAYG
jgi:hypothetical protein